MEIAKINGQGFSSDDLVLWLKLSGRFSQVIEDFIKEKMCAAAARNGGLQAEAEELQKLADESRRAMGLHRAKQANDFLDDAGATLDDFEAYLEDSLLAEKMRNDVQSSAAVEEYFQLNSPQFDSVDVSHMVVEGESQASEIVSLIEDGDETFADLAREYSASHTASQGGAIGAVYRGQLGPDLEARVFNAEVGKPLGPIDSGDGETFEIYLVNSKVTAELDVQTTDMIKKVLFDEWLQAQARTLQVQV